jgi:hypothetical protein
MGCLYQTCPLPDTELVIMASVSFQLCIPSLNHI